MTDPIQGASAAIQSVQRLQESSKVGGPGGAEGADKLQGPSFKEVMQQQTQQANQADAVQQAQGPQQVDPASKTPPADKVQPSERLDNFVKGVFKDESQINKLMSRCARGKTLEQGELLQLQGLIYSYGQKIDLASKLVDKATGGVKQIMNTQV